ncbi:MAG: hypothetical protein ACOYNO_02050 [Saprospiraceae bacterium]
MSDPVRIFLSFDEAQAKLVDELKQHIRTAFAGREVVFWAQVSDVFDERGRGDFLETASFSLIVFSSTYLLKGRNMLELGQARRVELERRPKAPVYIALAEPAVLPTDLLAYTILPHPDEPITQSAFSTGHQMQRVAAYLKNLEARTAGAQPQRPAYEKPFKPSDLCERLGLLLDRLNLSPVFAVLKDVVDDATLKQHFFELEDAWVEGIQACRLHRNLQQWQAHNATIKAELQIRIAQIDGTKLIPTWRRRMERLERGAQAGMGLFIPGGVVHVPESLHVSVGAANPSESLGLLNATQQQEYRRNLLLCQDALAVGNPERAHALAEHLRTHIDPLSAQLYEYLLISYLQKEGADRIVQDALQGSGRLFKHIELYASRQREYQLQGQCPTDSGAHNRHAVAEELSDALFRAYDELENDHVLDTGLRAVEIAEARPLLTRLLEVSQALFRSVHPYKGVLKTMLVELSGGGKSNWVARMERSADDRWRFVPIEKFDLESTCLEVLGQLYQAETERSERGDLLRFQLREDLYYSILEKRQTLSRQLEWEQKRYRKLTDERLSVIRLVQTALFGYQVFGDRGNDPEDQSFLRLAVEYLLPTLLLSDSPGSSPDQPVYPLPLRWFDLDEAGQVRAHPDNTQYRFDALAIVEKIAREQGGQTAWLQVHPNIHDEVLRQYVRDTEAEYAFLRDNRQYHDVRRLDDVEVRRAAIQCLQRWMIAYKARPEAGEVYLDNILQELVGNRLLLWVYLNPATLATHPDALALGYDALAVLKSLFGMPISMPVALVKQTLAGNLYAQTIEPAYQRMAQGDGKQRQLVVYVMLQALHAYRDLHPEPAYLNLVYQELCGEVKLPWIEVTPEGKPRNIAVGAPHPFDAYAVLQQLHREHPQLYPLLDARRRIAHRRHSELMAMYHREISDNKQKNELPERRIALDIIRGMKALYYFYPDRLFLELPIRELSGRGQVRWQLYFLYFFPIPQNHPENKILHFDYRQELAELRALYDANAAWMAHVAGEMDPRL